MKQQRHPNGSYFGPTPRKPSRLNVRNGLRRKLRFRSVPMIQILKEVREWQARMQAEGKIRKSNNNVKNQQGHHVISKVKEQPIKDANVAQRTMDAMKEMYPRVMSHKSWYVFSLEKIVKRSVYKNNTPNYLQISKMKHGLFDHSNDTKTSSRPNNLKAMPGLVLNSKGGLNVDQVATKMQNRDPVNGCNDITNDDNFSAIKETLTQEKPKSHDEKGTKGENPTHRLMKKQRKYVATNEDENDDQILEMADANDTTRVAEEKPKSHDENGTKGKNPNPTHRLMKKRRKYIDTNEDENDDQILADANDTTRVTSRDDMVKDCHATTPIPFVVDCVKKQCYCCSKPIDEPVWSGILKIGNKEYIPLAGHLSTKSCEKVRNISKSLPRVLEVTKTPRLNVWPKRWEGSRSSYDNIGLYFFPIKMRLDKYHDQLLMEIMENDLSLQAIIGDTEMLMFPSNLLPKRYQTFQMKHYLWGVFKSREVVRKKDTSVLHHPDGATVIVADATDTVSLGATAVATDASSTPIEDDATTGAPIVHANYGQIGSSEMGASSGNMVAFVVRQTPRLDQLIREIEREGSLVMRGEMKSSMPWLANMATGMQPESNKPKVLIGRTSP